MAINKQAALILSGGGASAAYEIGVMRALFEGKSPATGPLDPGIVTGTSAGAVNAALLGSFHGETPVRAVEMTEEVWRERLADRIIRMRFDPSHALPSVRGTMNPLASFAVMARDSMDVASLVYRQGSHFLWSEGTISSRLAGVLDLTPLIDEQHFAQTLRDAINLRNISSSEREIRVAATNWNTGRLKLFDNRDLAGLTGHQVLRASTAMPGVFRPVNIDGHFFSDGSLLMNTPLTVAVECGATEIHMIYVDPDIRKIPAARISAGLLPTLERAGAMQFAAAAQRELETASAINEAIESLARAAAPSSPEAWSEESLIRAAGIAAKASHKYKKLTVHRYRPLTDLGEGLGILDFAASNIDRLIGQGYRDALEHDCVESECILHSESFNLQTADGSRGGRFGPSPTPLRKVSG